MKCDECLHSRRVVSENGYHSVCCLLEHESRECIFGKESHFIQRVRLENNQKKEGQYDKRRSDRRTQKR